MANPEPENNPQDQTPPNPASEAANENIPQGEDIDALRKKLDALYKRLPKIIARIRDDTQAAELGNALNSLLKSFRQINQIEQTLLPPGGAHIPLSLSRLYELAVSGGDPAALEEAQTANQAFAHENMVLAETVESLTFQLETLRRQAADRQIENGTAQKPPLPALKKTLSGVVKTLDKIEAQTKALETLLGEPTGKALDERLAEELAGLNHIGADLLNLAPGKPGPVGRLLRRKGVVYDPRDMHTVRRLVLALSQANRRLTDLNETLLPAREQIEALRQVVTLIELYAGYDERNGPQYKEAMAEIDRLNERLARNEEQLARIADLDAALKEKREAHEKECAQRIRETDETIAVKQDYIKTLNEDIGILLEERYAVRTANAAKEEKHPPEQHALAEKFRQSQKKVEDLTAALAAEQQLRAAENATARARLRAIEGGLLPAKLESEILSLRNLIKAEEQKTEDEKTGAKALEDRIRIWVQNQEDLTRSAQKWRRRAVFKASFMAAAGGLVTAAGFVGGLAAGQITGSGPFLTYGLMALGVSSAAGIVAGLSGEGPARSNIKRGLLSVSCTVALLCGLAAVALPIGKNIMQNPETKPATHTPGTAATAPLTKTDYVEVTLYNDNAARARKNPAPALKP